MNNKYFVERWIKGYSDTYCKHRNLSVKNDILYSYNLAIAKKINNTILVAGKGVSHTTSTHRNYVIKQAYSTIKVPYIVENITEKYNKNVIHYLNDNNDKDGLKKYEQLLQKLN